MDSSIFSALEKIDIIQENPETQEQVIYYSVIETIGEESMFILAPVLEKEKMKARIGDTFKARITAEDCAYFFEATFLGYSFDDISLWEVSLPANVERSQMRKFVRVKLALEVKIEFVDEHFQTKILSTLTKDVSAGGLQIVMPVAPPPDSKVMVILTLTNNTTLKVKGEFVRIKYPKTEFQKHFASIKFCDLDEKLTNKVVKYIFAKEIEQRQKDKTLFE